MGTVYVYVKLPKQKYQFIRNNNHTSILHRKKSTKRYTVCLECDLDETEESIYLRLSSMYHNTIDKKLQKKVMRSYKAALKTYQLEQNLKNVL